MKCFFLIIIFAWQSTASLYFRAAPASSSAGNGAQIGAGVDVYSQLHDRIAIDIDLNAVRETKLYVGDGWAFRAQAEGLARIAGPWWAGGGFAFGRHANSQYTKSQWQPMASLHFRPHMGIDLYGSYLFPGTGMNNDNRLTTLRAGYRGVWRIDPASKWGIFLQSEFSRSWFDQPINNQVRRLASNGLVFGIGAARIYGDK